MTSQDRYTAEEMMNLLRMTNQKVRNSSPARALELYQDLERQLAFIKIGISKELFYKHVIPDQLDSSTCE